MEYQDVLIELSDGRKIKATAPSFFNGLLEVEVVGIEISQPYTIDKESDEQT